MAEQNIIRDFAAGKEKTFRMIYERYVSALHYFAAKYVEEDEVINDIIQDVFVSLWEKRTEFPSEIALKTFLYKSVKGFCLNTIRHQGVKERYAEVASREEEYDFFLDNIVEAEIFELLMGVFQELRPACREVYRLSLEGKKHEEIAELLQISVNTVKKHKNNANHYMRERLKNLLILLLSI